MQRRNDRRGRGDLPPRDPPIVAGRVPPSDTEAEEAVLSACLSDREALDRVLAILAPEHFYSEQHQLIFAACRELSMTGTPIDYVTVNSWLRDRDLVQRVGGVSTLGRLVDATPAVAHVETHARKVLEKWRLRRFIAVCQKYAAEGYGDVGEVQQFIDSGEQAVYEIAHQHDRENMRRVGAIVGAAMKKLSDAADKGATITGRPSGFHDFDKKTSGLHDGELMIVAAQAGMGKTSWVLNLAINVATPQPVQVGAAEMFPAEGVAFFSMEMPAEQIALRLLCSEARVDQNILRQNRLSLDDWQKLTAVATAVNDMPIWFDESPTIGLLELRAKVRRLQANLARTGCMQANAGIWAGAAPRLVPAARVGLVVVDYLQLMTGYGDTREQEISSISRGLKQLAKELRVPVAAISSLNRVSASAVEKRPTRSALRESGAIEFDADTIVFIYRDEVYRHDTEDRGIAELIIDKQRNGPTGTVKVRFVPQYTRFENLAPSYYEGPDDGRYGGN